MKHKSCVNRVRVVLNPTFLYLPQGWPAPGGEYLLAHDVDPQGDNKQVQNN